MFKVPVQLAFVSQIWTCHLPISCGKVNAFGKTLLDQFFPAWILQFIFDRNESGIERLAAINNRLQYTWREKNSLNPETTIWTGRLTEVVGDALITWQHNSVVMLPPVDAELELVIVSVGLTRTMDIGIPSS